MAAPGAAGAGADVAAAAGADPPGGGAAATSSSAIAADSACRLAPLAQPPVTRGARSGVAPVAISVGAGRDGADATDGGGTASPLEAPANGAVLAVGGLGADRFGGRAAEVGAAGPATADGRPVWPKRLRLELANREGPHKRRRLSRNQRHMVVQDDGKRMLGCIVCHRSATIGGKARHVGRRTSYLCETCNVPLCISKQTDRPGSKSCFYIFHEEDVIPLS